MIKPTERGLMFQATSTYGHGVLIVFDYADEEVEDIILAIMDTRDMMDWRPIGECLFPATLRPEDTLGDTDSAWEFSHLKRTMPHLRIWENGNCC